MAIEDFAYLENLEHYQQTEDPYALPAEVLYWIESELEKRRAHLQEHYPTLKLEIFRTLRTWQNLPVFVLGYREDDKRFIKEAWHYALRPAAAGETGLQLVLDRVPLHLFQTSVPEN